MARLTKKVAAKHNKKVIVKDTKVTFLVNLHKLFKAVINNEANYNFKKENNSTLIKAGKDLDSKSNSRYLTILLTLLTLILS